MTRTTSTTTNTSTVPSCIVFSGFQSRARTVERCSEKHLWSPCQPVLMLVWCCLSGLDCQLSAVRGMGAQAKSQGQLIIFRPSKAVCLSVCVRVCVLTLLDHVVTATPYETCNPAWDTDIHPGQFHRTFPGTFPVQNSLSLHIPPQKNPPRTFHTGDFPGHPLNILR